MVRVPDRFHRIAVNESIEAMALMAPNNNVEVVMLLGVLGSGPTPAVKMSMSLWMRWSGLSMVSSMNRDR